MAIVVSNFFVLQMLLLLNLFVKVGAQVRRTTVTQLKALSSVSFVPALRDKLKAV
jgi:hypothetical protein